MFMGIYAIIKGNLVRFENIKTRDEANRRFIELRDAGVKALATSKDDKVVFHIGGESDFVEHILQLGEEYCDWNDRDTFGLRILTWLHHNILIDTTKAFDGATLRTGRFNHKRYFVEEEFCKEDERLADMYGMRDKYFKYTFKGEGIDRNNPPTYCCEA